GAHKPRKIVKTKGKKKTTQKTKTPNMSNKRNINPPQSTHTNKKKKTNHIKPNAILILIKIKN
ncbi:hypothetical protein ABFV62_31080, partial [Pseudomonas syringae]|uniref:hypothetical protein n=1 Tax=Pseudomonas syringae TaxID=317 RepID=UPI0034D55107